MSKINYINLAYRKAFLNSEFGLALACKKLGLTPEQIEAKVGRYKRGKYKGQLRGALSWVTVVKGGWVKTGAYDFDSRQASGFVFTDRISFNYAVVNPWGDEIFFTDEGYSEDPKTALMTIRRTR